MKYLWIVVLVILGSSAVLQAQAENEQSERAKSEATTQSKSKDPFHRETPQSCVYNFQEACHASDYTRATKYLDLRKLPQAQRLTKGRELARQLCEILDRDTQFEVAELSDQPAGDGAQGANRSLVNSFNVNGKNRELDLERITLRSHLAIWVFSDSAVALIPELAQITLASPVEKHLPPPLVKWSFLDTSLWRWLALVLLAFALAALSRLFSRVVLRLLEPVLKRAMPRFNLRTLEALVSPLQLLLAVAIFRGGMEAIEPSQKLARILDRLVALLFFLALAWLCARIVDAGIGRLRIALESRRHTFTYSVLPLASRVIKIAILLLTIAAVLSSWGYNTTSILAGMGLGGIAVALAAQKTIENLFGGVAVISDRPVTVGDFCKFGDRMGTVEDIGLRSTRIRTPDRTLVTVPNGLFSSMTLENLDQRDKMLFHFTLNLRRDTKPDQVRALLASIAKILADHPKIETGALPVRFVGVGTYSLDVEVFAYVLTRNGDEFMKIQQDLYLWILDAVEAAGTSLALPTQASIAYSLEGSAQPNGARATREVAPTGQHS
jgi:MscS family membrane protein